jgi:hypothetical protein
MSVINNILCVSPNGKEFDSTLHWVKQFLNMLNCGYIEVESEIFGVYDGLIKGKHKVLEYQERPLPTKELQAMEDIITSGKSLTFAGWKFQVQ